MNDTEIALIAAIHAAPDDPLPRLAYADWLLDAGLDDTGARNCLPLLGDYEWQEAFAFAGEEGGHNEPGEPKAAYPADADIALTPFARRDVQSVHAFSTGERDEQSWLCVGQLWDGRFFALKAWCDYTGWD